MQNLNTMIAQQAEFVAEEKAVLSTITSQEDKEYQIDYVEMLESDLNFYKGFVALLSVDEKLAYEFALEQDSSPRDNALLNAVDDGFYKGKKGYTLFWYD